MINQDNENEIQKEIMIKDLRSFFQNTKKDFQLYYDNLEKIVEMHIMKDAEKDLSKNLQQHLLFVFNVNGINLFKYFSFPQIFTLENLDLDPGIYKKRLDFINKIKVKYGSMIFQANNALQMPFLINQVQTSIGTNESYHSMKIIRADGQFLEGVYKPETLMSIISMLLSSLEMSMKKGIFNLNENTVKNYIKQSGQFDNFLQELIKLEEKKNNE